MSGAGMTARDRWDAIIIGGGIVGCAAAWHASLAGLRVLILERDTPGAAQSGRNLGFVRQQARDFRELDLAMGARRIWERLEADLGRSVGWFQGGTLALALTEADMADQAEWQAGARTRGLDTRLLDRAGLADKLPQLDPRIEVRGAMFTPSDGRAEPGRATRALFDAAIDHGAQAILGTRVDRIDSAAGQVSGVWAGGRLFRAGLVVCAAGARSAALLRPLGIGLPQEIIRATVVRTAPVAAAFPHCVSGPTTGIRQAADGALHMSVAGGEYDVRPDSLRHARRYWQIRKDQPEASRVNYLGPLRRLLERGTPPPMADIAPTSDCVPANAARIDQARSEVARLFPAFAGIDVTASWAGYIDTLPDMIPAIGPHSRLGGLVIATGFSGHGFGPGPMVGAVLARLIQGQPAGLDLAPLSPERFARG